MPLENQVTNSIFILKVTKDGRKKMPRITVLNNPGVTYDFDEGSVTIGRGQDCEIPIAQNSVSRKHARLTPTEEGWLLEDLDSHNGLFLHNTRIKSAILKHSTNFRVGDVYLHIELPLSKEELFEIAAQTHDIIQTFSNKILGRNNIGQNMLIAAIAGGSVLLNGKHGQGKALAFTTMASILKLHWRKIPMTPDTLPNDVLGSEVFINENEGISSRFIPGPIFSHAVLADEINRAPGKTQAALIEAISLGKVAVANQFELLPKPLFFVATQNTTPDDTATPLSPGMLDNFAISLDMEYPMPKEELDIIKNSTSQEETAPEGLMNEDRLLDLQELLPSLQIQQNVLEYAGKIVRMTRPEDREAPDFIHKNLICGASTKAASDLIMCAKAKALLDGREEATCDDVRELAISVLRHRIVLQDSNNEGRTADDIVRRLLVAIPSY